MDQFNERRPKDIEAYLLESNVGYDILDAIVQANVKIESISWEEVERIVIQFSDNTAVAENSALADTAGSSATQDAYSHSYS